MKYTIKSQISRQEAQRISSLSDAQIETEIYNLNIAWVRTQDKIEKGRILLLIQDLQGYQQWRKDNRWIASQMREILLPVVEEMDDHIDISKEFEARNEWMALLLSMRETQDLQGIQEAEREIQKIQFRIDYQLRIDGLKMVLR